MLATMWLLACAPGSLSFDGKNDHVQLPAVMGADGAAVTVAAWIHPVAADNERPTIVSRRDRAGGRDAFTFRIRQDQESRLELGIANEEGKPWGALGKGSVPTGAWSFVAFTHDRATGDVRFYRDGQADGVAKMPFAPGTGADLAAWIGGDPHRGPTGRPFAGNIAGVWIWDAVLDAAALEKVRAGGDAGRAPIVEWKPGAPGSAISGSSSASDESDPARSHEAPPAPK